MAELTVIYWRDIPAQVKATGADGSARRVLSERFQKAIDAAAMRAGLIEADAYLGEWRQVTRSCASDIETEVAAEAAKLESEYGPAHRCAHSWAAAVWQRRPSWPARA